MELPLEKIAAELLLDSEGLVTPDCLTVDTLGKYIEHTLPSDQWDDVENHLRSCIGCLNRLLELRELLFLENNAEPLPGSLERKLLRLVRGEQSSKRRQIIEPIVEYLRSAFAVMRAALTSKYVWQGVCAVLLLVLIFSNPGVFRRGTADGTQKIASEVFEAIVTLTVASNGATIGQATGLVIDPTGFVVVPLHSISGGTSAEVLLANGKKVAVKGLVGRDEENDLAVIKLDSSERLKSSHLVDRSRIQTGDEVLAISKQDGAEFKIARAVLGEYIPSNPRGRSKDVEQAQKRQFIPIGREGDGIGQGVLTNRAGEIIGVNMVTPKGEKVGLAIPISHIKTILASAGESTPLGGVVFKNHPQEAVYYYVKGVLADDAGDINEAIRNYEKCLQIDPTYDQAHVAVGYLYYKQHDYDKEISHYKEAIRINPKNADAFSSLASAWEDKNKYQLAIEAYENALKINPDDEESLKSVGLDYLYIGRRDKALEKYEALKKIYEGAANDLKLFIDHWR